MGTQIDLHPVLAKILRALLFTPRLRFSRLNLDRLTTDHFSFHIRQLLSLDLIIKTPSGWYTLSEKGKEFANRLDTDKYVIERQAKVGVLLVCADQTKNPIHFLVQQRLKQPFFGYHGFPTGKITFGETARETAVRELFEETGLSGEPEFVGIKHKMDYSQDQVLLEDKFFFVFRFVNPKGNLIERFEGGQNLWLSKTQIFKLPRLFDGVEDTMNMVSQSGIQFIESKYTVSGF